MPKEKEKLTHWIQIRVSEWEKNHLQGLANIYAGGNLSLFCVYTLLYGKKLQIDKEDLHASRRKIKKTPEKQP